MLIRNISKRKKKKTVSKDFWLSVRHTINAVNGLIHLLHLSLSSSLTCSLVSPLSSGLAAVGHVPVLVAPQTLRKSTIFSCRHCQSQQALLYHWSVLVCVCVRVLACVFVCMHPRTHVSFCVVLLLI